MKSIIAAVGLLSTCLVLKGEAFVPLSRVGNFLSHDLQLVHGSGRQGSLPGVASNPKQETVIFVSSGARQEQGEESVLRKSLDIPTNHDKTKMPTATGKAALAPVVLLASWACFPRNAAAASAMVVGSSIVSFAHIISIMAITGCLVAERLLFQTDMTQEDEETLIRIDFIYGILAMLLIGSGFARAIVPAFGSGGDYYVHELLFWVKMTFAGIWGGLSIFPTLILRRLKQQRKEEDGLQLSDDLVARLRSIINAELSAILSIPLLSALLARGVGYSPNLLWQVGAVISVMATVGSFGFYGRQALNWSEDESDEVIGEEGQSNV